MNNLYHKVAVASVCTALGFVLGASEEAYSATFSLPPTITIGIIDCEFEGFVCASSDGLGDALSIPGPVIKGTSELATFGEFNIGSFSLSLSIVISRAIFQAGLGFGVSGLGVTDPYTNPGRLGIFGYVGNGTAEISDFEAGVLLSSIDISSLSARDSLNFDVTSFVNQRVNNGDAFAGFGIRALNFGAIDLSPEVTGVPLKLIVETTDVAEPVPEPTTIFGSVIALTVGGWLKRKKSSQQDKTASQR